MKKIYNTTSKFLTNQKSLSKPWIETPFFYKLLENNNYKDEEKKLLTQFHEEGYLIIDLKLQNNDLQNVINDIYKYTEKGQNKYDKEIPNANDYKKSKNNDITIQSDVYTFNDSPRLFEGWRNGNYIKNLCLNKNILDTLSLLYGEKPFPFSTINFIKGSNQPLHSDTIHFHTIPYYWMSGVWVALEDVDKNNGALRIIPRSHKWEMFHYEDLNIPHPDTIEDGEKVAYREYEEFLRQLIKVKNGKEKIVELKAGEAIIWASNLLHGGTEIIDENRTRLSQAIHYFYNGCKHYYHPMFSRPLEGVYATKWCNENNNIN